MIISVEDRRGSRWPVALVLAVLCGLAYVGVGFLQQRSLDGKVSDLEAKATALTHGSIAPATKNADLTKPLPHATATRLEHDLDKALSSGSVVRVRIFAPDGTLLFSTDPDDRLNTHVGDAGAIRAASVGSTSSSAQTDRVATQGARPSTVALLETFVQLSAGKGNRPGVAGVDQRYDAEALAKEQPWHTAKLGLAAAAALLVLTGLLLLARRASAKRAKTKKVAPPQPAKDAPAAEAQDEAPTERRKSFRKERAPSAAPVPGDAERARKDAQREMQVREALEGQLEQLRTRIREQEDLANRQVLELTQQLQVAASRVEDAEARAASSPAGADAERLADAERRAQEAAQRAAQQEARATTAETRVVDLEERLADAHRSVQPPPTDERIAELERALAAAREEAADGARRAEATEAVRDELETKVAQFGSRAQEQEATATALAEQLREVEAVRADLERRANEAESGGDAVRSEVAQLTAERDSLRARVTEQEELSAERDSLRARVEELEQVPTERDAMPAGVAELEHLTAERDSLRARVEELERTGPPAPPSQSAAGLDEIELLASAREELMDLRYQLAQAIERAGVAEERAAKLEADLLAERQGVRELAEAPGLDVDRDEPLPDDETNPFPWMNGNGNGDAPADDPDDEEPEASTEEVPGDRSLRYRLAQSAARKKGLGDIELPS